MILDEQIEQDILQRNVFISVSFFVYCTLLCSLMSGKTTDQKYFGLLLFEEKK
jgi:hypothetical protein